NQIPREQDMPYLHQAAAFDEIESFDDSESVGAVLGGGVTFVHLSTLIPAIKKKIEDANEQLGGGIILKLSKQEGLTVWMRRTSLPNFRKLYAKINADQECT
ncbi:RuBisCO large subunit-binding protein subunit alpha, partial [Tanacetum coccineum]